MIQEVIKALQAQEHYGYSNNIEIAKGKYELVTSWKDCKRKIKRILNKPKDD